jgi:hypothetical protein
MEAKHIKPEQRELFSWISPKLVVKPTLKYGGNHVRAQTGPGFEMQDGLGMAVYAEHEIKKDEVLFVMGGYILTIEDEDTLPEGVEDKPIELSCDFSIGPRGLADLPKMPQHYVNHSCSPNSGFDGQIFLVAMRDIEVEEEITYDYAMIMIPNDRSSSYFSFDCLCGQTACRGKVTEHDWQRQDLQERYHGYFTHGVAKLISGSLQSAPRGT